MGARWVPRWLAFALAVWLTVGAVTVAQLTSIPVHAAAVVAVWGLLALGHGWIHRRWRVAGPLAVGAALLAVGAASGLLPDGVQLGDHVGPAQSAAPKVIWTTLFVVVGADLALATVLHRRVWRTLREPVGAPPVGAPPRLDG